MNGILIQELTEQSPRIICEAVELLNTTQGLGYFQEDYLIKRIQSPDSMCVAAYQDKRMIAVGAADIITDFSYYLPFEQKIAERMAQYKVGSLSTLSVTPDLQGNGIGQHLSRHRLNWLRSKGCTWIFTVSWVSGLPHNSKRVFEKLGFRKVKEVPEFYGKYCSERYFECIGCHQHPCICPAILYESPVEALDQILHFSQI